jgi:hypothetical protein
MEGGLILAITLSYPAVSVLVPTFHSQFTTSAIPYEYYARRRSWGQPVAFRTGAAVILTRP